MIDIRFTSEMNSRNAAKVADVLREPRLWIPTNEDYGAKQHQEWLEKTEAELVEEARFALLAIDGMKSRGAIVFRPDPDDETVMGIRNISISPETRGRLYGSFMLRNVEYAARQMLPRVETFEVDTKATNDEMLAFLAGQGYEQANVRDLYDSGKPDVVLRKAA